MAEIWENRSCSPNDNTSFCRIYNPTTGSYDYKQYTTQQLCILDWTNHGYSASTSNCILVSTPTCTPAWVCELDANGNKTGYEVDGCGNRRTNPLCLPTTPPPPPSGCPTDPIGGFICWALDFLGLPNPLKK